MPSWNIKFKKFCLTEICLDYADADYLKCQGGTETVSIASGVEETQCLYELWWFQLQSMLE